MGFSTELQGQSSHEALLRLQDTEIQLLEVVKKCIVQRIKCDRDYANAISNLLTATHKFDSAEFDTPLFQAWQTVVRETGNLVKLLQENTEKLGTHTLNRLGWLISEKHAARKLYADERQRLQTNYHKLKEELAKTQAEYPKLTGRVTTEKAKYDDLLKKGKSGGKFDDASVRYQRSSVKLHQLHNDYITQIRETQLHGRQYCTSTLPALLQYQQDTQETAITHSKDILLEFVQLTDVSAQEFISCYQQIYRSIGAIHAAGEYDSFLNTYRTDPLPIEKFEFDNTFLEVYKGRLKENQIAVDDFTIHSLRQKVTNLEQELADCTQKLDSKQNELTELDTAVADMPPANDRSEDVRDQCNLQKKRQQTLTHEMVELKCTKERTSTLLQLLKTPLESMGDSEPPIALELTSLNSQDGAVGPGHNYGPLSGLRGAITNIKTTFAHVNPFRRNAGSEGAPSVPSRDFPESPPSPSEVENGHQEAASNEVVENQLPHSGTSDGYQLCGFLEPTSQSGGEVQAAKLEEQPWFHGVMPREEVQRLLVEKGDFVVRESRNRRTGETQFVLSVMWSGHKHFIIQGNEGNWRLEGETFDTVQQLVEQQLASGLPVTKRSEVVLQRAVIRESWELSNDDIILAQKIGNGNFGKVFRGTYTPKNMEVAVKTCRETLSDDAKKKFLQEARILRQYDHPNIVKFIGIAAQRQPVMIVMEYVPGGSLLSFLRKSGSTQTKNQLLKMCEDAAAGMAYLENANCIHRDLAARNCLVGTDNIVKISDFGMSREEEEYTVSSGMKQIPIKWTAPEALNFGTYTWATDVWSFGILMWEVFAFGATPYPGLTNSKAKEQVDEGYRMSAPEGTVPAAYDVMLKCWEYEPSKRPHFDVIYRDLQAMRTSL